MKIRLNEPWNVVDFEHFDTGTEFDVVRGPDDDGDYFVDLGDDTAGLVTSRELSEGWAELVPDVTPSEAAKAFVDEINAVIERESDNTALIMIHMPDGKVYGGRIGEV